MILTPEDFIGEANIPDTDSPATQENLNWFINKYEPKYLKALLGSVLYSQFRDGLAADPVLPKWSELLAKINEPLVYYVYWHWLKSENSYANRGGVSRKKSENAENVSPGEKMVQVWNDMVETNLSIVKEWDSEVYEDYYFKGCIWPNRDVRDIFTKQSMFNI